MMNKKIIPFNRQISSHKIKRIYAFGLDLFLIGVVTKVLIMTFASFFRNFSGLLAVETLNHITTNLDKIYVQILALVFWGYFTSSYYMGQGRTFGKLLFKLRVFSHAGNPHHLSFQEAFLRTFGHFICYITFYLPFIINFIREDGLGVADWLGGSRVVSEEEFKLHLLSLEEEKEKKQEFYQLDFMSHL